MQNTKLDEANIRAKDAELEGYRLIIEAMREAKQKADDLCVALDAALVREHDRRRVAEEECIVVLAELKEVKRKMNEWRERTEKANRIGMRNEKLARARLDKEIVRANKAESLLISERMVDNHKIKASQ
jgi:hypothetical protein